jgi:hypothetical protein
MQTARHDHHTPPSPVARTGGQLLIVTAIVLGSVMPAHGQASAMNPGGRLQQAPSLDSSTFPTQDALEGPPPPWTMYAVAGLDSVQLERYIVGYRRHVARTLATRQGIIEATVALRTAVAHDDKDTSHYLGAVVVNLWNELLQADREFDSDLPTLLYGDQLARYDKWEEDRHAGAEVEQRLERRAQGSAVSALGATERTPFNR